MRAVKSVISAAGNLKRQYTDMDEVCVVLNGFLVLSFAKYNSPSILIEEMIIF